jgi:hypothetical protein
MQEINLEGFEVFASILTLHLSSRATVGATKLIAG